MMNARRKPTDRPSSPRLKLDRHDWNGIAIQVGFQVVMLTLIVIGQFVIKQLNDQINGEPTVVGGAIVAIASAGFYAVSRLWRDNTK